MNRLALITLALITLPLFTLALITLAVPFGVAASPGRGPRRAPCCTFPRSSASPGGG